MMSSVIRELDPTDVRRLEALGALHGLELHLVAFAEAAEALGHDGGVVDEQIRPVLLLDETKTLCVVEPLHSARLHRFPRTAARPLGLFIDLLERSVFDGGKSKESI